MRRAAQAQTRLPPLLWLMAKPGSTRSVPGPGPRPTPAGVDMGKGQALHDAKKIALRRRQQARPHAIQQVADVGHHNVKAVPLHLDDLPGAGKGVVCVSTSAKGARRLGAGPQNRQP